MVILQQSTIHQLKVLLNRNQNYTIDGLLISQNEEIAPNFLLDFTIEKLNQDYDKFKFKLTFSISSQSTFNPLADSRINIL